MVKKGDIVKVAGVTGLYCGMTRDGLHRVACYGVKIVTRSTPKLAKNNKKVNKGVVLRGDV